MIFLITNLSNDTITSENNWIKGSDTVQQLSDGLNFILPDGMIYSPDILFFGFIGFIVINILYFMMATIERKLWATDRLSRSNMIIFFQCLFVSIALLLLDGERLLSKPALIFIASTAIQGLLNAILNSNERIKLSKGDMSIEVEKTTRNNKNKQENGTN